MPHTYISAIFQDSRGYLWFGTADGLSRFDGLEFKNYRKKDGLAGNVILSAVEDRNGRTWIGTLRDGVSCFSEGKFKNYTTHEGLPGNTVWATAEDPNGMLWFGTEKGLARFDGKRFDIYTTADGLGSTIINYIAVDRSGKLWAATTGGLSCFRLNRPSEGFVTYTTAHGLLSDRVLRIYHDSAGRTWIGTDKGLNCLQNGKFSAFTAEDGLVNHRISALHEDREGNIWIGTLGGIGIFSRGTFIGITTGNGLPYNFIHDIMQDREGNTWIATSGGASCLRSLNIMTYSEKDGLSNNLVKSIIQDRAGSFWIATGSGLSRFDGATFKRGQFKNYSREDGLIGQSVNGLMEDRHGNTWVTTAEGLSIVSPRTGQFTNYTKEDGLPTNVLFRSLETRDGTIWIGNQKGVICFRSGKFSPPPFNIPHQVTVLLEDKQGNLWLGSDSGLYRWANPSSSTPLTRFTEREGLPGSTIFCLFEDSRGRLWIGGDGGLSRYVHETGSGFINYTSRDGLPHNACSAIEEDRSGNIWIVTGDGLACFDGQAFKTYTRKHGLPADIWTGILTDRQGTLWLGSTYGLTRFVPPPVPVDSTPPPVYISGLKVMEKEVPLSEARELEHNRNYLRFGFVGLCFSAPGSVTYRYRLKGIDEDWLVTRDRSLFYAYLPPGSYTFQVKAVNNDGIESANPAELSFRIRPPYWKTWWFQILMVLSLPVLLTVIVLRGFKRSKERLILKARTRQLIMSQRMELMGMLAASAVHDLKNLLSIIIGYSEIVAEKYHPKNDGDEIYNYNENIKSTANTAVQVVKQILALARQKHDDGDAVDLTGLLTQILEILKVTAPGEISVLWQPPPGEIVAYVNPIRFQQLMMNLCINAVQAMPEGGELKISLGRLDEQRVRIEVSDTGPGIDEETLAKIFDPLFTTKEEGSGTGLGLFVVKQIVDELQGNIEVKTQPGKGATFVVTFAPGVQEPF